MNAEEAEHARTVGMRLWRLRDDRRKSLQVIAELAGMSTTTLWRIEQGKRALASQAEVVALANALQIAPDELTRLPVPAPANGHTDSASDAVRLALMAVSRHRPGGEVVPVEALQARVQTVLTAARQCRQHEVSSALPALIRDVHTSLAAGRDVAELLDLAVVLHVQAVSHWLREVGAPLDLRRDNDLTLVYQLAERRDTPVALGLATYGATRVTLAAGAFELARAELDAVTVPTNTPMSMQLAGMLALSHSLVATTASRPADVAAALGHAAELAARTGDGTAYGLGFGPANVGFWHMESALESGDHELATALAEDLNPDVHPYRSRQSAYWRDYGRGLARQSGRCGEAVTALRRAETIHPHRVLRDPMVHEVLGELLPRTRRDSPAGRELRGMARRAKLLIE